MAVMGVAQMRMGMFQLPVAVLMGMQERLMTVEMAVLLTQKQRHAGGHQSRCQQQGR